MSAPRDQLAVDEVEKFDDDAARTAFRAVFSGFIKLLPGNPWARTAEMAKHFRNCRTRLDSIAPKFGPSLRD